MAASQQITGTGVALMAAMRAGVGNIPKKQLSIPSHVYASMVPLIHSSHKIKQG